MLQKHLVDLNIHRPAAQRAAGPERLLKAIMAVLFLGPLIAPLFQASGLPFIAPTGALARDLLAQYICPTPAKSYMLVGFPMAVCARCWGATIGLWAAWLAFRRAAGLISMYRHLVWPLRLLVSALPFGLWVAEIAWWPAAPYWALLLNGALAGFWAGLFFCSIWPGLAPSRAWQRS